MKSSITYGVSMRPDKMCYLNIAYNTYKKQQLYLFNHSRKGLQNYSLKQCNRESNFLQLSILKLFPICDNNGPRSNRKLQLSTTKNCFSRAANNRQWISMIWRHQFVNLELSNSYAYLSFAASLSVSKIPTVSTTNGTHCLCFCIQFVSPFNLTTLL